MPDVSLFPDGTIRVGEGITVIDPLPLLGHTVRLEPAYSLRAFFAMLDRYPELLRLGEFLEGARAEVRACPPRGCVTASLECLELRKVVRLIGFPGTPRIEILTAFEGLGGGERQEIRFFGFDSLLDMPVRLGKLRHEILGDAVSVLECDTAYGLFEMIEAVAWELGFHHVPQHCTIRR